MFVHRAAGKREDVANAHQTPFLNGREDSKERMTPLTEREAVGGIARMSGVLGWEAAEDKRGA